MIAQQISLILYHYFQPFSFPKLGSFSARKKYFFIFLATLLRFG